MVPLKIHVHWSKVLELCYIVFADCRTCSMDQDEKEVVLSSLVNNWERSNESLLPPYHQDFDDYLPEYLMHRSEKMGPQKLHCSSNQPNSPLVRGKKGFLRAFTRADKPIKLISTDDGMAIKTQKPVVAMETPKPVVTIETPKPVVAIETPKPVVAIKTPKVVVAVKAPTTKTAIDAKKGTTTGVQSKTPKKVSTRRTTGAGAKSKSKTRSTHKPKRDGSTKRRKTPIKSSTKK